MGLQRATPLPLGISIHAPREGGDPPPLETLCKALNFNPRPPRGGRLNPVPELLQHIFISIHAPREGGDNGYFRDAVGYLKISIHAPREGGDCDFLMVPTASHLFQSTPPARGATALFPPLLRAC